MKHFVMRLAVVIVAAAVITLPALAQSTSSGSGSSDNAFIAKAMEANYAEVVLGRLAESKAQNPQVKDFANMMVQDHHQALERMHNMMGSSTGTDANMNMSSSETGNNPEDCGQSSSRSNQATEGQMRMQLSPEQQLCNRLSKLSGATFDREYINVMVQDHRKDVREFEREAGITSSSSESDLNRQKPSDDTGMNTNESDLSTSGTGIMDAKQFSREMLPTLQKHLQAAEQIQRQIQK
jgi:putative membrane protein